MVGLAKVGLVRVREKRGRCNLMRERDFRNFSKLDFRT